MFSGLSQWYANRREFKNVTEEEPHYREETLKLLNEGSTVEIYKRKGTLIVYSYNHEHKNKHLSISNNKRRVKDWELSYALNNIMDSDEKAFKMFTSNNGVVHIEPLNDSE